ncbi:MAG: hypothetical protein IKL07_03465 [Clostridium sp.]|nr:hypothetical protein [Clostridium sp.]
MNIENIANAMAEADKHRGILTEEERSFIAYFAYQTGDMKQTKMLIDRLVGLEEGSARRDVVKLFEEQLYKQPKAIRQIEELLVSIERYRIEEQKAINELSELLTSYGISIMDEELKRRDASKEDVIESGKVR